MCLWRNLRSVFRSVRCDGGGGGSDGDEGRDDAGKRESSRSRREFDGVGAEDRGRVEGRLDSRCLCNRGDVGGDYCLNY